MTVTDIDDKRLHRQLEKLEQQLPAPVARSLRWLRDPAVIWVRVPVAILLMLGGIFSFLPIFGLWMLPIGLILLAQDIPFLKRPTGRTLVWIERRWVEWRRKRRSSAS